MQHSFSRLWDGYESDDAAKKARDARYREMKKEGRNVKRFSLANQLKKYDGLGQPNGSSCPVYYINEFAPPRLTSIVEQFANA